MATDNPRIFIVDDDLDFASLLADVFSQASYEVETTGDPTTVEDQVRAMDFSLVVTDYRMPGMDGLELARKIRAIKPEVPIIMVSGYLDSKDREKMEAEGIVGLYEKPLSVFSLLKNAAKLIAESKARNAKSGSGERETGSSSSGSEHSALSFPFSSLPCRSEASITFAESIYRMKNRKQNLCLITPAGTPTRAVANDFFAWMDEKETGCHLVEPTDFSSEKLTELVAEAAEKNWTSMVICIPETDHLDPAKQRQLARGSRKGTFREQWKGQIRFLFMISSDVETLYQEGTLSDELYLTMGGSELSVPPLDECPEDIEELARSFESESGSKLEWEDAALTILTQHKWQGNHAELRKFLVRLQNQSSSETIGSNEVSNALNEDETQPIAKPDTAPINLRGTLEARRNSYLSGLSILLDGDLDAVSSIARVPRSLVDQVLNK